MRPREFVSKSRHVDFSPSKPPEEWPEWLIHRGSSWNEFSGCLLVFLSPSVGLLLDVVGISLHDFAGTPRLPPLMFSMLSFIVAAVWWIRRVIDAHRQGPFEVAVRPLSVPGVMGELFQAEIEVTMPDDPTEFRVSLARHKKGKQDRAGWSGELRIPAKALRKVAPHKYTATVAIPIPMIDKYPGRDWVLSFEARCNRFGSYYLAFFSILMNENQPYGPASPKR